jgi:hypothetical protein
MWQGETDPLHIQPVNLKSMEKKLRTIELDLEGHLELDGGKVRMGLDGW